MPHMRIRVEVDDEWVDSDFFKVDPVTAGNPDLLREKCRKVLGGMDWARASALMFVSPEEAAAIAKGEA